MNAKEALVLVIAIALLSLADNYISNYFGVEPASIIEYLLLGGFIMYLLNKRDKKEQSEE